MEGDLIVKNLSQTRWSARAEAVKALKDGISKIKFTLETIEEDTNLKAETRRESEGLVRKWSTTMEPYNLTSKPLQSATLALNNAVNMLLSLKTYVEALRNKFDEFEEMEKKLTANEEYRDANIRKRQRSPKITRYDGSAEDAQLHHMINSEQKCSCIMWIT